MSFKKDLRRQGISQYKNLWGQASLEYFILLAMIAGLTLLSFSNFHNNIKKILQGKNGFFQRAAVRLGVVN